MLERGAKRVVQRLLGEVEVAEQADERCEDAAGLGAVDPVDHRRDGLGCSFAHSVCGGCDIIVAARSSVAAYNGPGNGKPTLRQRIRRFDSEALRYAPGSADLR